jgi:hypothetical protein
MSCDLNRQRQMLICQAMVDHTEGPYMLWSPEQLCDTPVLYPITCNVMTHARYLRNLNVRVLRVSLAPEPAIERFHVDSPEHRISV